MLELKLKSLGYAVAQLVEATSRKVAGSIPDDAIGIFINRILPAALWPMFDSACNRNEYQEYFLECKGGRCQGLITLPLSYADCLEIWKPQPPGTLRDFPGL